MKLTKGRISKILNKRKQTLKKNKNKKRSHNGKTFRKNTHVNLHNSTLKNVSKGGSGIAYDKSVRFGGENEVMEFDKKEPVSNISSQPVETIIQLPESAKDVPTVKDAIENIKSDTQDVIEELEDINPDTGANMDNIVVVDLPEQKEEFKKDDVAVISEAEEKPDYQNLTDEDIEKMNEEKKASQIVNHALREFSGGKRKKRTRRVRIKKSTRPTLKAK